MVILLTTIPVSSHRGRWTNDPVGSYASPGCKFAGVRHRSTSRNRHERLGTIQLPIPAQQQQQQQQQQPVLQLWQFDQLHPNATSGSGCRDWEWTNVASINCCCSFCLQPRSVHLANDHRLPAAVSRRRSAVLELVKQFGPGSIAQHASSCTD